MSVNQPQLSQKPFVFWCQWIHLSCYKNRSRFDVSESTSAVTKTVRVLMSVDRPQLLQKTFVFWCQWINLSCHKKHSCFEVSNSTLAVTAMKMLQGLFCVCDKCRNGIGFLQYVALKEYLFLPCHHRIRKNYLQWRGGTKMFSREWSKWFFQGLANSREIYFCQLETKKKIFWKHALIKLVIRIYQNSKFREYKVPPPFPTLMPVSFQLAYTSS